MLKLNGGVDLNSHLGLGPINGELRDNPPALSHDHILGFEDIPLIHRSAEKFASLEVNRNTLGCLDSEIYEVTIGSSGSSVYEGSGNSATINSIAWVYHDPLNYDENGKLQFYPSPDLAGNEPIEARGQK